MNEKIMLLIFKRSLVIALSLLTISNVLSLDIGTVKLEVKVFEPSSAQVFNNIRSGIHNDTAESTIPADGSLMVKLLADNLENRLNKSAAILEITGQLPQVKNVSYASSINSELHGIPKDADLAKKVAQDILTANKDFRVIGFIMPNGDMYLEEPYSRQQNLTRNNFADREYFKGAVSTHDTYLGGVFVSASSGLKQVVISVPIYSENNKESSPMLGTWIGGLDNSLEKSLQSLNITDNEYDSSRFVYVDQYGQKVADSDKNLANKTESFVNLQAFNNLLQERKPGSVIEMINGTRMVVFYEPVQFRSAIWAVILLKPL